ncbi:MAG: hypothetical protein QM770_08435 [Tepidisphaeraceae bacterium]
MASKYLPRTEEKLVTWTGDFLTTLQTKPANYFNVPPTRIADYAVTRTRFVEAYGVASNPTTRTGPAIEAKNVAKKTLINSTRSLVDEIQAWPQTTNEMRRELGITERGKKPTPSPIPPQAFVKVESVNGREVTLSIQQSKTTKSKPRGVLGANVMIAYGDEAPASTLDYTLATVTGKSKTVITLDAVREACTVWISAFWFNGRKQTGPASDPVSVNLSATSAVPATMKLKKAA